MEPLRAGFARETVTPIRNYDLSGYVARENPAVGVHDAVQVSALYLAGGEEAMILSIEALGFAPGDAEALRQKVAEACAIRAGHVMLAATHTHSTPATMHLIGCGRPDDGWTRVLQEAVERVAREAKATAAPAHIGVGSARVTGIARNRRRPAGPVDEAVTVVKVEMMPGRRQVVVVNFACHPVVLPAQNRLVSGDYPGAVTRYLAARGVDALFLTGACGDINPPDHGNFDTVAEIGERLGREAEDLLPSIATSDGSVRVAWAPVTVRWQMPTASELQANEETWVSVLHDPAPSGSRGRVVQAWSRWIERHRSQNPPWPDELEVPVQVIKAGPALFVALPGEVFCRTGLVLKEKLGPATVVSGYTNGNIGYLPTEDEYVHGGYEVAQAHVYYDYPGVVVPGTAERMAKVAVELAENVSARESV